MGKTYTIIKFSTATYIVIQKREWNNKGREKGKQTPLIINKAFKNLF